MAKGGSKGQVEEDENDIRPAGRDGKGRFCVFVILRSNNTM